MRDYLLKVLELTKRYRFRFVLGLLCGLLSGTLALALPLSLKLAVDTVFPTEKPPDAKLVSVTQANSSFPHLQPRSILMLKSHRVGVGDIPRSSAARNRFLAAQLKS